MTHAAIRLATTFGFFLVIGRGLGAQAPPQRQGFWVGFGLGYGSANSACDYCADWHSGGATVLLKAGGTLGPSVRLGAVIEGWSPANTGATTVADITASLYYYPLRPSGFFLTGGLGISRYDGPGPRPIAACCPGAENPGCFPGRLTGPCYGRYAPFGGLGFTAGLGYDVRIAHQVFLTPVASYVYGFGWGWTGGGWTRSLFDFGLGVTYH